MSLTPKQLLAETAKFFSINPSKWIRGRLQRGDCFCTVGYMAHRLQQEGVPGAISDPYRTVRNFMRPLSVTDSDLTRRNDSAADADEVVQGLKDLVNAH